jgi:pyruvate/2-oxoglutarate/acetoin dehydrogenase E1 component
MATLADTIKQITSRHLETNQGRLYAQCVKAVGWIGGTVPDVGGIVELPTSDVSNGGVVVGAALAGERPIYVVRYQGFLQYNMITILNYAAKSLEMWGVPCPVLVRGLSMEGSMGPVASNAHHSLVCRMPGIKVYAPITSYEWATAYDSFMGDNQPYFLSESRMSFNNTIGFVRNHTPKHPRGNIVLIGQIRLKYKQLIEELPDYNILHVYELNPLILPIETIVESDAPCVVVDSDYTKCGIAEHVAYEIMNRTGNKATAVGLEPRTAGFSSTVDNVTPTIQKIKASI